MVVDDHEVVRAAVIDLLERADDVVVCAMASGIDEAEQIAADVEPDVVVIDLYVGDVTCIAAARRIREASPGTQLVMLTAASDRSALLASIFAGAAGCLPKQPRGIDLVGTVRKVARGERLLDPVAIAAVIDDAGGQDLPANTGNGLPDAELGLLALLAAGRTDAELESELHVDRATVRIRVARLMTVIAGRQHIVISGSERSIDGVVR